MSEFLKINATEDDPIIRWINLDTVMYVVSTKTNQVDRLNIKFIDSTSLVIEGELAADLKIALHVSSINHLLPDERDLTKVYDDDLPSREEIEAMREIENDDYLHHDEDEF
jgi:hypothetical protein